MLIETKLLNKYAHFSYGDKIIKQVEVIDQIAETKEEQTKIFDFLTKDLGLAISWDKQHYTPEFYSGGVSLSGIYFACILKNKAGFEKDRVQLATHVPGGDFKILNKSFKDMGVKPTVNIDIQHESQGFHFVIFEGLLDNVTTLTCDFKFPQDEWRQELTKQNMLTNTFGLLCTREVVFYYSKDCDIQKKKMESVFQEKAVDVAKDQFVLRSGSGPLVRCVKNDKHGVHGIVLQVVSLEKAKKLMVSKGKKVVEEKNGSLSLMVGKVKWYLIEGGNFGEKLKL